MKALGSCFGAIAPGFVSGFLLVAGVLASVPACGGSCPQAEAATTSAPVAPAPEAAPAEATPTEPAPAPAPSAAPSAAAETPAPSRPDNAVVVKFPENASVAEAVAAVPRGTPRANIDAETLAEPLQQESLWKPCNVGNQHFKVKVAVWAGQAVGVDVTTTSKALAACVEKQVRSVEWRDKVRSLNSVEYSM